MVQLQGDLKELEDAGIQVIGISYDSVKVLKSFSDQQDITFPLLSDTDSKTIDAFGIRNKDSDMGIPYPGTFLLDSKGVIRAKLFKEGFRVRHTTDELLKAAKGLE